MNWINVAFFAVVLTSITGSCAMALWAVFRSALSRRGIELVYFFLKAVLVLYLVPFVYGLTVLEEDARTEKGLHMWTAPELSPFFESFGTLWLVAAVVIVLYRIPEFVKIFRLRKGDVPVEQEGAEQFFREVCADLGIKRKMRIYSNDLCGCPVLTGLLRPTILLPYHTLSNDELRMIFYHELTHYRKHELWFKYACECVKIFHWFNPLVYCLLSVYTDWSESNCDLLTCQAGAKYFNCRQYFAMLLTFSRTEEGRVGYLNSYLFGNKTELQRRIERMKIYKKRKFSRAVMSMFTGLFLLGSSVPAYAISATVTSTYETAVDSSLETMFDDGVDVNEIPETEAEGVIGDFEIQLSPEELLALRTPVDYGDNPLLRSSSYMNINWTLKAGRVRASKDLYTYAGNAVRFSISVSGLGQVGVVYPDGIYHCVQVNNAVASRNYIVPTTGYYFLYVRNLDSKSVKFVGPYWN